MKEFLSKLKNGEHLSFEESKSAFEIIMGLMHKKYNIHGVQFHPESIKTTIGLKLLKNFINYN